MSFIVSRLNLAGQCKCQIDLSFKLKIIKQTEIDALKLFIVIPSPYSNVQQSTFNVFSVSICLNNIFYFRLKSRNLTLFPFTSLTEKYFFC